MELIGYVWNLAAIVAALSTIVTAQGHRDADICKSI